GSRVAAKFECCWLSWVGAVTGCLKALGVDCDPADVAGHSGYAFVICIHQKICPSGPTMHSWDDLAAGVRRLGRSTQTFHAPECHIGERRNDRTRAHCRAALEAAKREIDAGRPCVINGAYLPEFAIVTDVRDDAYIV